MGKKDINILVIDDDKIICDNLNKLLVNEGYKVKTITNPMHTIREMDKHVYHLIILDLKMPKINGEDLLKEIRKVNNDISVIILTAYPSVDSAVQAFQSQAYDYVKKPFKIDEIRDKVRSALVLKMLLLEPDEELNLKIGKRVKGLRSEKRLTLMQLAERTGLSASLISQIERSASAASISTINKIAISLNIGLKEFFETF